jgi:hypothetical protein
MGLLKNDKLNRLQELLPEGAVVPSHWLQDRGYSRQLIYKYVKNAWLVKRGPGAYYRRGSEVSWQGIVASWQQVTVSAWHVGGETALNLQGFAHYLPLGGESYAHIYGQGKVPGWVRGVLLDTKLVFHARRLFNDKTMKKGFKTWPSPIKNWPLTLSGPERAMLEMLPEVHDEFSFTHAAELMQGLMTLRPESVMELLRGCTHIKTKRLFLFLADYYQHPWLEKVDAKQFDLGSGKRSIVQGGRLDKTYMITVPEAFHVNAG